MSSHLHQRTLLILILAFLAGFLLVAVARGNFATVDLDVNTWAASINTGPFTPAAKSISIAFDATALTAVSVAIAVALLIKKRGKYGVLLLAAMAGDLLLVQTCKEVVASQRPPNMIFAQTGYSFPSGHVTGNIIFFGVLTYFAWCHWHSAKAKTATGVLYIAVTTVVAFDRIYLNVHWFSDILGSVLLGAFWLLFCILLFQKFALTKSPKRKQKN
jgi:membrane-associated phospholipid phosphatase